MARIENLHFRAHAELLDLRRHFLQHRRRVCHDVVAASPKFIVPQSSVQISGNSFATCSSRSVAPAMSVPASAGRHWLLDTAERKIAAHAGSEVDDDVDARLLDVVMTSA